MKPIISVALISSILLSCNPKINCRNGQLGAIILVRADTLTQVADTSYIMYKYVKGTNFTQLVDTFHFRAQFADKQIYLTGTGGYKFVDYDWRLIFDQTGRQYSITNTRYISRKERSLYDGYQCYNNVSFSCNGRSYTINALNSYTYLTVDY